MSIVVLSINHHKSPVAIREQLSFTKRELADALCSINAWQGVDEAVIISTCNRVEVYASVGNEQSLFDWLAYYKQVDSALLREHVLLHRDHDAVSHLMNVASGLDSMVVGEPQILGQVKAGFTEACLQGTVGRVLSRLFRQTFSVAKKIRATTSIGACPVSVASTVCALAKQTYTQINDGKTIKNAHVMVIGAGDTSQLVLKHLATMQPKAITVVSRHIDHAQVAAELVHAKAVDFDGLGEALPEVDIVISATASDLPVITQSMSDLFRTDKAYLLIDIAVPRDIDVGLGYLENVHLYNIDDLKQKIDVNVNVREHAALQAGTMVGELAKDYMLSLQSLEAEPVIKKFRAHVEKLCQSELEKSLIALESGLPAEQALSQLATSFANKLMHTPCMQMKQAGYEGRAEVLHLAHELFGMHEQEISE